MELTFDALSKNYGKKQALIGFSAELTGGIYGHQWEEHLNIERPLN